MNDLISRARFFATEAHGRINHLRKYTGQPYQVHLKAVAQRVSTVTDDEEVIAAAWLHDTVEDTPATFEDIEREFGSRVRQLVAELTDVSRSSDGNRAARKQIDRQHLQQACPEAKSVKLADLIDNCVDICRNDERFGRVFLQEMAQLLPFLKEGDQRLYSKAVKLVDKWSARWNLTNSTDEEESIALVPKSTRELFGNQRINRMFVELFSALDIAEPLLSFDTTDSMQMLLQELNAAGVVVAGIRQAGVVNHYVFLGESGGTDRTSLLTSDFSPHQIVSQNTSLSEVIGILSQHKYCFVRVLEQITAVITREDIQKPVVRMWLFGMVTMTEMYLLSKLKQEQGDSINLDAIAPARLDKARALQTERSRRGQHCDIIDCLQFSDKAILLLSKGENLQDFGFKSKAEAKKVIKELESLRNNLAHSQDFVAYDWPQIVRMTHRVEMALREG